MSRRPKVASPSTSLGSTLSWLPSAPTKPCDSRYTVFTKQPQTPMTPRLQMSQFKMSRVGVKAGYESSDAQSPAPGDTVVWRGEREEVEMSWGLSLLIDEWSWMRMGWAWSFQDSSSQNKFINRPYFSSSAYSKHTDRKAIELMPPWHLISLCVDKGPSLSFINTEGW